MSWARCNYLSPDPDSRDFIKALSAIIKRERINVVLPTDDNFVKALSDARGRLPIELLLPRKKTIDLCQDEYALTTFLRRRSIAAPLTYEVRSLPDIERISARFSRGGLLWCRARRGARSVAAIPVATAEQARARITLWRDYAVARSPRHSRFRLSRSGRRGRTLPGAGYRFPSNGLIARGASAGCASRRFEKAK
jgi:hypothetical protein